MRWYIHPLFQNSGRHAAASSNRKTNLRSPSAICAYLRDGPRSNPPYGTEELKLSRSSYGLKTFSAPQLSEFNIAAVYTQYERF